jgi:2-C-methyl-D-erythritol 4-phosphate cytidylyltransferase/2-C-methyl-D-erythritol 2,4-cyclodiphosphate synthase
VHGIWPVVAPTDVEYCRREVVERYGLQRVVEVVAGGATRQESVFRGVCALPDSCAYVLVHDGARPLVTRAMVQDVLAAALADGAATAAVPVKDAVRRSDADGLLRGSVEREGLWRVQTPQGFRRDLLLRAHHEARRKGLHATDDATLVEAAGLPVRLVTGDERNLKVTSPDDVPLAEALLRAAGAPAGGVEIRTGIGYDIHRLAPGRRLLLGGVQIPHTHGLLGHSDADALAHAVCDALLGAAGLGDIGTHFPDTDPQYCDADSMGLLGRTAALVARHFRILHVDSTVKAQAPHLNPHIGAMRARLAEALRMPVERVNVKAKTGEGFGPVGEGLAIEAEAVATLAPLP